MPIKLSPQCLAQDTAGTHVCPLSQGSFYNSWESSCPFLFCQTSREVYSVLWFHREGGCGRKEQRKQCSASPVKLQFSLFQRKYKLHESALFLLFLHLALSSHIFLALLRPIFCSKRVKIGERQRMFGNNSSSSLESQKPCKILLSSICSVPTCHSYTGSLTSSTVTSQLSYLYCDGNIRNDATSFPQICVCSILFFFLILEFQRKTKLY